MNIESTLQRAIRESGLSIKRLAELSGVDRCAIIRLMAGSHEIGIWKADRLAAFLGYSLCRTEGQPEDAVQEKHNTTASR